MAIDRFRHRRQSDDERFAVRWQDFLENLPIMSYTELTVWTRGIIMDKEGRDIVNSVAMAGRTEGKYTQAMENYVDNPDRTNAPTRRCPVA